MIFLLSIHFLIIFQSILNINRESKDFNETNKFIGEFIVSNKAHDNPESKLIFNLLPRFYGVNFLIVESSI